MRGRGGAKGKRIGKRRELGRCISISYGGRGRIMEMGKKRMLWKIKVEGGKKGKKGCEANEK